MDSNSTIIDYKMSTKNIGNNSHLCAYILLNMKNGPLKLIKM